MTNTWKDYPRTKDKVAIVGFHDATRDKAPFNNPDYEIWTLNEEYNFDWIKRSDRHFQLHPRWDYTRTNNLNDPNHFLWLKNETGDCLFCKGTGKLTPTNGQPPIDCIARGCVNGTYTPFDREHLVIYLQKATNDIPNSVTIPLDEMTAAFLPTAHYYTSSVAYMLALAMLMGFKEIELYGFDMGTDTEYHYQRANFEYWIGIAHGRGVKVTLPDSQILKGKLYGYDNMRTGYRQQLEFRSFNLNQQFHQVKTECTQLEAQIQVLNEMGGEDNKKKSEELFLKLQKKEGLLNFINGAKTETQNLTGMFESYMRPNNTDEETEQVAYEDAKFVGIKYAEE